jgi:hypothetical protein
MYLKSALLGVLTVEDMRSREYGHNLANLWRCFKDKEAGPAFDADPILDRFDATIFALHDFEDLRYPDKLKHGSILMAITWHPSEAVRAYGGSSTSRQYEVFISEVDALVIEILDRIPLDPNATTVASFGTDAQQALRFRNPHATRWTFD